ncbi:MAG: hypothetical protein JWQ36_1237 [Enterovirga sp.]|nr:hypothetical protein [Enterovirga sp.]
MSLVHNERIKLTANWLNSISAASMAVGGFAQLAPLAAGSVTPGNPTGVVWFSTVWIVLGLALHVTARILLKRLQE